MLAAFAHFGIACSADGVPPNSIQFKLLLLRRNLTGLSPLKSLLQELLLALQSVPMASLPLLVGALLVLGAAVVAFQPLAGRHMHTSSGTLAATVTVSGRKILVRVRQRHKQHKRAVLLRAASRDADDDDADDDDDDDDDIELSVSATANFVPPPTYTFGLNAGRSAPSQRLAMGKSSKDAAHVFVCSNCGSEFIQWVGRCPTCREYNTIQEMRVGRRSSIGDVDSIGNGKGSSGRPPRPVFGGNAGGDEGLDDYGGGRGLDDNDSVGSGTKGRVANSAYGGGGGGGSRSWIDGMGGAPVPVTQVYEAMGTAGTRGGLGDDSSSSSPWSVDEDRLVIPDDDEFNRVLGGGIMPGSLILLGGPPGVGKSSILLQTAGALAALSSPPRGIGMGSSSSDNATRGGQGPVVYVSGEESTTQVASRAARLGIDSSELLLVSDNDADRIAETVVGYFDRAYYDQEGESRGIFPPCLLAIDSIQTMTCLDGGNTSPGGVSQVRAVANLFLRLSKSLSLPVVVIGHVTKDGQVAGPRTVEHMVSFALGDEVDSVGFFIIFLTDLHFGHTYIPSYDRIIDFLMLPFTRLRVLLHIRRLTPSSIWKGAVVAKEKLNPSGYYEPQRIVSVVRPRLASTK